MRHSFLFGPYFMPFFNGQFLKCDILPVSNDSVFRVYVYLPFYALIVNPTRAITNLLHLNNPDRNRN